MLCAVALSSSISRTRIDLSSLATAHWIMPRTLQGAQLNPSSGKVKAQLAYEELIPNTTQAASVIYHAVASAAVKVLIPDRESSEAAQLRAG